MGLGQVGIRGRASLRGGVARLAGVLLAPLPCPAVLLGPAGHWGWGCVNQGMGNVLGRAPKPQPPLRTLPPSGCVLQPNSPSDCVLQPHSSSDCLLQPNSPSDCVLQPNSQSDWVLQPNSVDPGRGRLGGTRSLAGAGGRGWASSWDAEAQDHLNTPLKAWGNYCLCVAT